MRGIQLFHYKYLLDHLRKLQQVETFELPCEHANMIIQQEEKLKDIYNNYQLAIENVSFIIKQFEEHKRSIKKVMVHHQKFCSKHSKRKKVQLPALNNMQGLLFLLYFLQYFSEIN
jgi:hypothetical protein